MRSALATMVAALLMFPAGARAQQQDQSVPPPTDGVQVNQIDFGVRGTSYGDGSDRARCQRYRDLDHGATIDLFRAFKDTNQYRLNLKAEHIGYSDQRFFGGYNGYGKVKASFEWNQIPLFYSESTSTLYDTSSPASLAMNDSIQAGIQNKTTTLNQAMTGALPFDLRTRRDIGTGILQYSATPNLDWNVAVRNTQKSGGYPWGGSFGISNAIASEMPVPVDHRTTDVGTNLEFSNERGFAKLAYDGSFFRNNETTL